MSTSIPAQCKKKIEFHSSDPVQTSNKPTVATLQGRRVNESQISCLSHMFSMSVACFQRCSPDSMRAADESLVGSTESQIALFPGMIPPVNRSDVRFLYIEDNKVLQKMFQKSLASNSGFALDASHTVCAKAIGTDVAINGNLTIIGDGEHAISMLANESFLKQFHVIMFDFQLARSSGPQVFRHVQSMTEGDWRPLCLSYSTELRSVEDALEMGMDGGLEKPALSESLQKYLDDMLASRYSTYTKG